MIPYLEEIKKAQDVLYHGSPDRHEILKPRNRHGDPDVDKVIFATPEKRMAVTYTGRKWSDRDLGQGTGNSATDLRMVEMRPNAFKDIYRGSTGYLHELPPANFKVINRGMGDWEYISKQPVKPVRIVEIKDAIKAMQDNGVGLVKYNPNSKEFLETLHYTIKRLRTMPPDNARGYLDWRMKDAPSAVIKYLKAHAKDLLKRASMTKDAAGNAVITRLKGKFTSSNLNSSEASAAQEYNRRVLVNHGIGEEVEADAGGAAFSIWLKNKNPKAFQAIHNLVARQRGNGAGHYKPKDKLRMPITNEFRMERALARKAELEGAKSASITLDIEKGDTLLGGRFKNIKTVVKDIGTDELGQPTINGKKLLSFRIAKKMPDMEKDASIATAKAVIAKLKSLGIVIDRALVDEHSLSGALRMQPENRNAWKVNLARPRDAEPIAIKSPVNTVAHEMGHRLDPAITEAGVNPGMLPMVERLPYEQNANANALKFLAENKASPQEQADYIKHMSKGYGSFRINSVAEAVGMDKLMAIYPKNVSEKLMPEYVAKAKDSLVGAELWAWRRAKKDPVFLKEIRKAGKKLKTEFKSPMYGNYELAPEVKTIMEKNSIFNEIGEVVKSLENRTGLQLARLAGASGLGLVGGAATGIANPGDPEHRAFSAQIQGLGAGVGAGAGGMTGYHLTDRLAKGLEAAGHHPSKSSAGNAVARLVLPFILGSMGAGAGGMGGHAIARARYNANEGWRHETGQETYEERRSRQLKQTLITAAALLGSVGLGYGGYKAYEHFKE